MELLTSLKNLKTLTLDPNWAQARSLTFLSELVALKKLHINLNQWETEDLKGLIGLEHLCICIADPSGEFADVLMTMKNLKVLEINSKRSQFEIESLDVITTMIGLEELVLRILAPRYERTNGIAALTNLKRLELCSSGGFAPSVDPIHLPHLQLLRLSSRASMLHQLFLTQLQILHLHGRELTEQDIQFIGGIPTLTELDIRRCSGNGIRQLGHLTKLKYLSTLNLTGCDLGSEDVTFLGRISSLCSLDISTNYVGDSELEFICESNRNLQCIWIDTTDVSPEAFLSLAKLPKLKVISYPSTQMETTDRPILMLKMIANCLYLQVIDLSNQSAVVDDDLFVLRNVVCLKQLFLGGRIKGKGLCHLIDLNLRRLEIDQCIHLKRKYCLQWLPKLPTLRILSLQASVADLNLFEECLPKLIALYYHDERGEESGLIIEGEESISEWEERTGIQLILRCS